MGQTLISRSRRAAGRSLRGSGALRWCIMAMTCAAASAQAIGMGDVLTQSDLGHRLRLVVPITAQPTENLAGECFRLASTEGGRNSIPELNAGRVALERLDDRMQLVVSSPRTINDP